MTAWIRTRVEHLGPCVVRDADATPPAWCYFYFSSVIIHIVADSRATLLLLTEKHSQTLEGG